MCAWFSTVLAKSGQQHGATGGIQTVPALKFTCQRTATHYSPGKQTGEELSPKALSISQQPWRARPTLWPRALPCRRVPQGTTARLSGRTNTSRSMHQVGSHVEFGAPRPFAQRCTSPSTSFLSGGERRKCASPTAAHGAHAARAANGFASPSPPAPSRH